MAKSRGPEADRPASGENARAGSGKILPFLEALRASAGACACARARARAGARAGDAPAPDPASASAPAPDLDEDTAAPGSRDEPSDVFLFGRDEESVLEEMREAVVALPDVRKAKVALARKRIRSGFYDRPEVLEEIALRLSGIARKRVSEE